MVHSFCDMKILTHWSRDKMAAIFADDISKFVLFVDESTINNKLSLVQMMARCHTGD